MVFSLDLLPCDNGGEASHNYFPFDSKTQALSFMLVNSPRPMVYSYVPTVYL